MNIYIEADSIARTKISGIGHATLEVVHAFDRWLASADGAGNAVTIIIPFGTKGAVDGYGFKRIRVRVLPPGYKYINFLLVRTSLPIPIDLWFGKGVYIFMNYKTWWVPFSRAITFVQDVAFKKLPETIQPKNLPYMQANFTRWAKRADVLVTTSTQSAREFAEYFPEYVQKNTTIPLGVDLRQFRPQDNSTVREVLAEYELPERYFLYVSSIEPRKNVDGLLEAYRQYSDMVERPAALLLVGGDGWKNEQTLKRIRDMQESGYAVCRPSRYVESDALPALYSGAVALVSVSLHEGFGLSPLQAQACGTPIIASDIPVFKEVLLPVNVTYVPYDDSAKIAEAMVKVAAAKNTLRKQPAIMLTWDNTASRLIALARKLQLKSR